jgi:hypothetical protein
MGLLGMVEAIIEDLGIPTVLRGYLTQSDGDAVLSTTLPKNLHGSKTIPKSLYRVLF